MPRPRRRDGTAVLERITRSGVVLEVLGDDVSRMIVQDPRCDLVQHHLAQWYNERTWLRCGCAVIYYIRLGRSVHRNPGQPLAAQADCGLCVGHVPRRPRPSPPQTPTPQRPDAPLVRVRGRRSEPDVAPVYVPGGTRHGGVRYASLFSRLWSWMETAGLNAAPGGSAGSAAWARLRRTLASSPSPLAGRTWADLAWMPDSCLGPDELFRRADPFRHGPRLLQIPILGILLERLRAKNKHLHLPMSGLESALLHDIPEHLVSRIGGSGPYLTMAVAYADPAGLLRVHHAILQSVVGPEWLLPVDSSYEREVARLLLRLGMSFYKPLRYLAPGVKPDYLLMQQRIILEVKGLGDAEYEARKARTHEAMRTLPLLRGWRLIEYDARPGRHTLAALQRRLEGWWRPNHQIRGWILDEE